MLELLNILCARTRWKEISERIFKINYTFEKKMVQLNTLQLYSIKEQSFP